MSSFSTLDTRLLNIAVYHYQIVNVYPQCTTYLIYQEGTTFGWSGTLVSLGLSGHLALGWPSGEHVRGNRQWAFLRRKWTGSDIWYVHVRMSKGTSTKKEREHNHNANLYRSITGSFLQTKNFVLQAKNIGQWPGNETVQVTTVCIPWSKHGLVHPLLWYVSWGHRWETGSTDRSHCLWGRQTFYAGCYRAV